MDEEEDDDFEFADLESAIAGTLDDDDDLDDFELEDFCLSALSIAVSSFTRECLFTSDEQGTYR